WADSNCTLSPADQQSLVNFFQQSLRKQLAKNFKIVTTPQPGAVTIQVALVDASAATPFLRSVSMIIPQMHLLASLKNMASGSYPFVGAAQAEMKVTDSMSGALLAAAADRQLGGGAFKTGFQWKWGDAENACTGWSTTIATRLKSWTSGKATP
ncbi:MAG: DUF3313 domain-containing protein, partial [Deltaproteobacteria bacterium]|nr:DUF3313 domain-containing protein [Deltaproteobacteria bacterium]